MHDSFLIRNPPPSQQEYEPDPPMGAPPPYRLPPQPGMNVSSPHGNNQYYPGSAQGDWRLGAFVSKIFWFNNCKKSRVENRFDNPGGVICLHPSSLVFCVFEIKWTTTHLMFTLNSTSLMASHLHFKLFTLSITLCNISFISEHWHATICLP